MIPYLISYGTKQPAFYAELALLLRAELKAIDQPHIVDVLEDQGGYVANNRYKPFFIMKKLALLEKPVFWFDVDGSLLRPIKIPNVFLKQIDVGLVTNANKEGELPWSASVIFFNATLGAFKFLLDWETLCRQDKSVISEHRLLIRLLKKDNGVKVRNITQCFQRNWIMNNKNPNKKEWKG